MQRIIGIVSLFFIVNLTYGQISTVNHWESVVLANDTWKYFVGTTNSPPEGWRRAGFNDSGWLSGKGGIGYGDGDDSTNLYTGAMPPSPPIYSVYLRIPFTIQDTSNILMAALNIDYDDGFVAWINEVEIARAGIGVAGDLPEYNTPAADHEAVMKDGGLPQSFFISPYKTKKKLINGINYLTVQVNNSNGSSSDLSAICYLSLGMKNSGITYRPVPSWFNPPVEATSHLPLVLVYTNGNYIMDGVKGPVTLNIIDNGYGNSNSITDPANVYAGMAGIEIRGSSSTMFPKKNYGFELWNGYNIDTAYSLLGMPAESDWMLHGPYSDKSLIRNYLAYNLAAKMGHYAPRTRMCEMYIDEQFQGFYILLEKIKRDKNRVAIAKLEAPDISGNALTGGYIVKIDRSSDGSYQDGWFSLYDGTGTDQNNKKVFFAYNYPKWENIQPAQKTYIKNHITSFEESLKSSNFRDPATGYRKYIDVNSFLDYFILVELSKNVDGYRLSTFLHKDRDDRDPLIHMGPVWDYDLAFGDANYYDASLTYNWNYTYPADGWGTPFWWSRLLEDPYFVNALHCRWNTLRQGPLSDESLMTFIDASVDTIGDASTRNFSQWDILSQWIWPNNFVGGTYEAEISYLKNWILERTVWMDSNMPGTCTTGFENGSEIPSLLVRAWPNPAIKEVNMEIENPLLFNLQMDVYSVTGQLVYTSQLERIPILTQRLELQPGVYMLRILGGTETRTIKIIIQ
jgi:hypothetical protein